MKRSIGLILLLAFSGAWSITHLIHQNNKYPTLELDVKNTLKELYLTLNDNPILENVPEWLGTAAVTCAKNYQENGVLFYHVKTSLFLLTLLSVILMFFWKRSGFYMYLASHLGTIIAIFIAFEFNGASVLLAFISSILSLIMIRLYYTLLWLPIQRELR